MTEDRIVQFIDQASNVREERASSPLEIVTVSQRLRREGNMILSIRRVPRVD